MREYKKLKLRVTD